MGPFNAEIFLLMVDTRAKWIEVFPMSATPASATIRALRFLFATCGLPEVTVADHGRQFVAQEMKDFVKLNGIRQVNACLRLIIQPRLILRNTTPQALCFYFSSCINKGYVCSEAERAVRTFKESTKTMKVEPGTQAEKLAFFLLGIGQPHKLA